MPTQYLRPLQYNKYFSRALFCLFTALLLCLPVRASGAQLPEFTSAYLYSSSRYNFSPQGLSLPARRRWSKDIGNTRVMRAIPESQNATPVLYDGAVYIGSSTGAFYALTLNRGKKVWRFKTKSSVESAAAVDADNVCFGTLDGFLRCLDRNNGEQKFSYRAMSSITSTPLIDDGRIYFTTSKNRLHVISLIDGHKLWSYSQRNHDMVTARFVNSPAIGGAKLFLLLSNGHLSALNKKTGKEIWTRTILREGDVWPLARRTPMYYKGTVYIIDSGGALLALDADTGATRVIYNVARAVDFLVTDRAVYIASASELVAIDKASGDVLWTADIKDGSTNSVTGAGDQIFVISSKEVEPLWLGFLKKTVSYATVYSKLNGSRRWRKKFRTSISSNATVTKDYFTILTDRGRLYVYGSKKR